MGTRMVLGHGAGLMRVAFTVVLNALILKQVSTPSSNGSGGA